MDESNRATSRVLFTRIRASTFVTPARALAHLVLGLPLSPGVR
jgi:hypothetical protein